MYSISYCMNLPTVPEMAVYLNIAVFVVRECTVCIVRCIVLVIVSALDRHPCTYSVIHHKHITCFMVYRTSLCSKLIYNKHIIGSRYYKYWYTIFFLILPLFNFLIANKSYHFLSYIFYIQWYFPRPKYGNNESIQHSM